MARRKTLEVPATKLRRGVKPGERRGKYRANEATSTDANLKPTPVDLAEARQMFDTSPVKDPLARQALVHTVLTINCALRDLRCGRPLTVLEMRLIPGYTGKLIAALRELGLLAKMSTTPTLDDDDSEDEDGAGDD
jgi:hypothetical protein